MKRIFGLLSGNVHGLRAKKIYVMPPMRLLRSECKLMCSPVIRYAVFLLFAVLLAGCGGDKSPDASAAVESGNSNTQDAGNQSELPPDPHGIFASLPSEPDTAGMNSRRKDEAMKYWLEAHELRRTYTGGDIVGVWREEPDYRTPSNAPPVRYFHFTEDGTFYVTESVEAPPPDSAITTYSEGAYRELMALSGTYSTNGFRLRMVNVYEDYPGIGDRVAAFVFETLYVVRGHSDRNLLIAGPDVRNPYINREILEGGGIITTQDTVYYQSISGGMFLLDYAMTRVE